MTRTITATAVLLLALTGCGGGSEPAEPEAAPAAPAQSSAPAAPAEPEQPGPALSPDNIDPWPLTVRNIVVECAGDALFGVAEGSERFALNGTAEAQLGFPSISTVQVEGESVKPILDAARARC